MELTDLGYDQSIHYSETEYGPMVLTEHYSKWKTNSTGRIKNGLYLASKVNYIINGDTTQLNWVDYKLIQDGNFVYAVRGDWQGELLIMSGAGTFKIDGDNIIEDEIDFITGERNGGNTVVILEENEDSFTQVNQIAEGGKVITTYKLVK